MSPLLQAHPAGVIPAAQVGPSVAANPLDRQSGSTETVFGPSVSGN